MKKKQNKLDQFADKFRKGIVAVLESHAILLRRMKLTDDPEAFLGKHAITAIGDALRKGTGFSIERTQGILLCMAAAATTGYDIKKLRVTVTKN